MALPKERKADSEILRQTVIGKINSIKKKKFDESLVNDFSWAFKVFLKRHLSLNYEFTHEELLKEIGKAKLKEDVSKRIMALSSLLENIKYGNLIITKEHFEWMLNEGNKIINLAILGKEFLQEPTKKKTIDKEKAKAKSMKIKDNVKQENKSERKGIFKKFFFGKPETKGPIEKIQEAQK